MDLYIFGLDGQHHNHNQRQPTYTSIQDNKNKIVKADREIHNMKQNYVLVAKKKRKRPADHQWRKVRAKIRGTGKDAILPPLSAANLIQLFSPGIKGAYINKDGYCVKGTWSSMGEPAAGKVTNHIIDAVYMMAKSFCPEDPHELVREVCNRGLLSLPKCAGAVKDQQEYKAWCEEGMVKLCLTEYKKATKNIRRRQVLSWVASTDVKKKWIKQLFGVSYDVIYTAVRHARKWRPGGKMIRLSLKKKRYHQSARSTHLKKWLKDNTVCDPAGKNKSRRYRLLPRHSGYEVYENDCKRKGVKPFCRSHFYKHESQKGITNSKCRAGMCSICIRYGEIVFDHMEEIAAEISVLIKPILVFDLMQWRKSFKKVRKYFVRGGMFQHNLRESCTNIHHCLTFALSHPDDERFQHKCDHDHTEVTHSSLTHTFFTHTHSSLKTSLTHSLLSLSLLSFSHTLHTDGPVVSPTRFIMEPTLRYDRHGLETQRLCSCQITEYHRYCG